jgi:hypothetical protein
MPSITLLVSGALIALVASTIGPVLHKTVSTLGVFRTPRSTVVSDWIVIQGDSPADQTRYCEDLHLHSESGWLFAGCEGADATRFAWWPPLGCFLDPRELMAQPGSLMAIDSKTFKSKRLELVGFDKKPFFTHGIDILTDPEDKDAVYIYAINHLPSPAFLAYLSKHHPDLNSINHTTPIPEDIPRAQSQIEVFHHKLASSQATHLRSIQHPLLRTPNDVLATGDDGRSLYVTNDHFYRGGTMRAVEDVWYYARWSDTIHVQIDDLRATDPTAGFAATVALTGLHNNNGLGRGASPDEVVITSAASGDMHLARLPSSKDDEGIRLQVQETVHIDSSIDNPSYFVDRYATSPEDDKSGYVHAGLSKAADLLQSAHDPTASEPVIVWLVTRGKDGASKWNKTVLFEDDGSRIRSSSTAILIGIDPALEGGRKRAWLVVTGFFSSDIVAVKVDL